MWVCSHSDKYREKPDQYTVLPPLLAERGEIEMRYSREPGVLVSAEQAGPEQCSSELGQQQKAIMWGGRS